jgi:hypothetical protein
LLPLCIISALSLKKFAHLRENFALKAKHYNRRCTLLNKAITVFHPKHTPERFKDLREWRPVADFTTFTAAMDAKFR